MIIRDLADRTAGTHIDVPPGVNLDIHPRGPHLSAEQLGQSERYALVAWGIAEKIRLSRFRAGLSIRQLSAACQIDAAQLSRIENGSSSSNVSLEVLLRIVRCLGLEIDELLSPEVLDEGNPFKIESIDGGHEGGVAHPLLCTPRRHLLHLLHWNLPEGETIDLGETLRDPEAHRSWIVLKGEAIFDLVDPSSGTTRELVDHDSVVHCRYHAGLTSIRALQDLELLGITYSPECPDS
jgi:transcriptional regulator with XRE-family HTH domain